MPLVLFVAATAGGTSAEPEDIESRAALVKLELNQPSRSAEEKGRDRNRLPRETLGFFGLRDDMRVIELFPGEGWYTRLLAPFLAENGILYVAMGTGRVEEQLNTLACRRCCQQARSLISPRPTAPATSTPWIVLISSERASTWC